MKIFTALLFLIMATAFAEKKPNIIFFLTDDQRYDFLGCSGHPVVKTPNIDKLAAEGTRFERMFVNTATCWISRATMFSGTFLRTHRYTGNALFNKKYSSTSYPRLLKDNGYQVAYFGKNHVKFEKGETDKMYHSYKVIGRNPFFKKQKDGSLRHETEVVGDEAEKFIDSVPKGKPFQLNLSFNASHAEDSDKKDHFPFPKAVAHLYKNMKMPLPNLHDSKYNKAAPDFLRKSMHADRFKWRWDTPEKYQHNMRNYLRMISGIDGVVGRIIEKLKSKGLAENTILIYAADNGYYAGDRGFAGKWTHYDQSLRVPLVIFDPRLNSNKGQVAQQIVMNADIPATILEYAGVKRPDHYDGKSLKAIIEGKKPSDWRKDALCEFFAGHATIPNWEGIRGERYVYARYVKQNFEFLHDLEKDPNQLINYATNPEYKAILEKMRARCDEVIQQEGGVFKPEEYIRKPRKKKKK